MDHSDRITLLVARSVELDTGTEDCFDPCSFRGPNFWEQGAQAFRNDVRLEECPYDSGPKQDDWLRGWMATELIEFGRFKDEPGTNPADPGK